jgi:hypothetical protein
MNKKTILITVGVLGLGAAAYFGFKKGGFLRKDEDEEKSNACGCGGGCGDDCSCKEKKSNASGDLISETNVGTSGKWCDCTYERPNQKVAGGLQPCPCKKSGSAGGGVGFGNKMKRKARLGGFSNASGDLIEHDVDFSGKCVYDSGDNSQTYITPCNGKCLDTVSQQRACRAGAANTGKGFGFKRMARLGDFGGFSNAEGTYNKRLAGGCPCKETAGDCNKVGITTHGTNANTGEDVCICNYECPMGTKGGGFIKRRAMLGKREFSRADGYGGEQTRVITIG